MKNMNEEKTIGYSQAEYYSISSREGLPKRCPILRKCCKAVWTRYILGFDVAGAKMSFKDFLSSERQYWEPDKMIKEIEQMRWIEPGAGRAEFYYAVNICPEISLFEERYLPPGIVQAACGDIHYYYESKRAAVTPKHYSECAEFSEYWLTAAGKTKQQKSSRVQPIQEQYLEDFLVNNLDLLEPGLKFVERQKKIGKWKADIFATDLAGAHVLIELKAKSLNRDEIDKLCGQVSRYYHLLKPAATDLKMFIVIPTDNRDLTTNIYHGLKLWIDNGKVVVFQFDYKLFGETFVFSKVVFGPSPHEKDG